ncbi:MAG: hypothetical protein Alis3KO_16190 [Aliiglaciecola sp.]|uniref:hypothetical protein n=1 Tax=Aliiglaciecola sp. M165 TaxID=2593649 RepID=UPI00117D16EA|nr:hypothetical protein [Aliiglaciecola sp. M165]TRY31436.1 hypothetical protein FM019_11220 [Aliiglaciecola sp. M165]
MSNDIQIGIPCVYEDLCFWLGVGFGVLVIVAIATLVWSVWQDKRKQEKQRQIRKEKIRAKRRGKFR